jgi:DNA-binding response OmpR family regulator
VFDSDAKIYERLAPHMQRVLIVDAQPAAVRLLTELLRNICRCQVWSAPNPERGMALAKSVSPQIIFVDQSKDVDGIGFTRAMRRSTLPCRQAPVIMITAGATAQTIIGARDAGAHEFLRKPYTIKDLVRRLEAVSLRRRDWIEAVGYIGPDRRRFNSGDYSGPLKRRTDASEAPDSARLSQALKILRAAAGALEQDPSQAMRAMRAQADECQRCALAMTNTRMAAAAGELQRVLRDADARSVDRRALEACIDSLWMFMPGEGGPIAPIRPANAA